ncbi:MAG: DUF58 domain-containing protein [Phycisphaerae bacterium]|nr:DUF58 domain-containing protein [Phycisphaerae bacterium]
MAKRRYEFADEAFLARLERLHLIAKRLASRQTAGARRSGGIGDGLEFADHRAYSPGDDIRFIDWPYYARMDKLLLRLFHPHSDRDVVILLDTSGSMAPTLPGTSRRAGEKFNAARRIVAALAYVAMGALDRVVCQPFGETLGVAMHSGRNRRQVLAVLDFLAGLEPGGGTALSACVRRMVRARSARAAAAIVVIVSDLVDAGDALDDALGCLTAGGHDVAVLQVYGRADADPPAEGAIAVYDAETQSRLDVHVTDALRRSYRRRFEAFRAGCERLCRARGASYAAAPSDLPMERFVLHTLRRAGVLAG